MFRRAAFLTAVLSALGCAPAAEPPARSGQIDLTQPESERTPIAPLGYCTEDEAGCGRSQPNRAPAEAAPAPAADETVWFVPIAPTDPVRGPADALVTLAVFSDFECPYCRRMATVLYEVLRNHPKDVRLVWKDFPLPQHAQAQRIAEFARAIQAQGGNAAFWTAHDRLFEKQADIDDKMLRTIAGEIPGIRWNDIEAALKAKRYSRLVLDDFNLGDRVDIQKTPTTFVNGRKADGLLHAPILEQLIAEELQKAKALVDRGTPPANVYERIVQGGKQIQPTTDLPAE